MTRAIHSAFRLIPFSTLCAVLCVGPATAAAGDTEDWPQHLGPGRNGQTKSSINTDWPRSGPEKLWEIPAGEGWSSPVGKMNRCILYHRKGDMDRIQCHDLLTGQLQWEFQYRTDYRDSFGFDNGPRATPLWLGDKVYCISATGVIHCLNDADGSMVWKFDAADRVNADTGFFGLVCSPLAIGDAVIFQIGGDGGHGIIALDARKGSLRWKSTSHKAGYSSPVLFEDGGRKLAVCFTRRGLLGLDSGMGETVFEKRWRSSMDASVNAATPIIDGNEIFLTASYDTGAILLKWEGGSLTEQWSSDSSLSAHYATPILVDGTLYGIDGRVDFPGDLSVRAVDWRTGDVLWKNRLRTGASIISASNAGLIQLDDGEIWLVEWSREGLRILKKAQVQTGLTRAVPALVQGIYLVKSSKSLMAYDLRPADAADGQKP